MPEKQGQVVISVVYRGDFRANLTRQDKFVQFAGASNGYGVRKLGGRRERLRRSRSKIKMVRVGSLSQRKMVMAQQIKN
ncbi:MAG: hypothetical protein WBD95_07935, partial [Xanthobacteraceae bacterium]